MPDPFSGGTGSTKQELNILQKEGQRNGKAQTYSPKGENAKREKEEKEKNKAEPPNVATLYKAGLEILRNAKYLVEMEAGGAHVNHRIMKSMRLTEVKGITYPPGFQPLQDIHEVDDLNAIEKHFTGSVCGKDVREFWKPLFTPQSSDSPLSSFTDRHLKMKKIQKSKEVHEVFDYGHTFDPMGRLGGRVVCTPKIWVPDEAWFDPAIRELKFSDVFTIFPPAEQEMLKLIIGRVGVGCSNHLPPGMDKPVSHTARMAAVIVGKDAG